MFIQDLYCVPESGLLIVRFIQICTFFHTGSIYHIIFCYICNILGALVDLCLFGTFPPTQKSLQGLCFIFGIQKSEAGEGCNSKKKKKKPLLPCWHILEKD
ncbi:hypothetical protein GDO81_015302 [Engystomops pustulosus]|uniref:Vomeronasal type-1 receptor n=1 Tax=Engystomops pustulosus TaxID=76066 RepID=A0AAV7AIA7_ENGPU|nr:hypothetical protein GDO81_015302 [Engystomops pustulosus]